MCGKNQTKSFFATNQNRAHVTEHLHFYYGIDECIYVDACKIKCIPHNGRFDLVCEHLLETGVFCLNFFFSGGIYLISSWRTSLKQKTKLLVS